MFPTPPSTIYCTPLGTFDAAGALTGVSQVPINYGTGPSHFVLNLRLSKTFGFGAKARGAGRDRVPGGQVEAGTEVADMDTDPCSAEAR